MSPEDIVNAAKSFIAFCVSHPRLSVLIVLGLAGVGVVRLFHGLREIRGEILWIKKAIVSGGVTQRAIVAVGVLLSVGLSILVVQIVVYLNRPGPVIRAVAPRSLGPETTISWTFERGNGNWDDDASFRIDLTDLTKGERLPPKTTPESTYRILRQGRFDVRVTAPNAASSSVVIERYNSSLDRVRATGKLRVAVHLDDTDDQNPDSIFCFQDAKGQYDGFDMDVVRAIAAGLGEHGAKAVTIEPRYYGWPAIIEAPNSFEVDLAIASISITDERKQRVLFSEPYYETSMALIELGKAAPGGRDSFRVSELSSLRMGVHRDTTELKFLEDLRRTKTPIREPLFVAPTNKELFSALLNQRIDGILYDYARSVDRAAAPGSTYLVRKLAKEDAREPERYGITFAKVNGSFADAVNVILAKKQNDLIKALSKRFQNHRKE
jgi:ABC-type amino acid transport substrate-binding protein